MRIVLPGECDATVKLNVVLCVEDLRTDRLRGGHRGSECGAVQVVAAGGVPRGGRGHLRVDQHVREMVFDRLERADGPAELLTHFCVVPRHLQGAPS